MVNKIGISKIEESIFKTDMHAKKWINWMSLKINLSGRLLWVDLDVEGFIKKSAHLIIECALEDMKSS